MAGFDESFESSVRKFPQNTALIHVNNNQKYHKITYEQLMEQVLELAQILNKYLNSKTCVCIAVKSNLHLPSIILRYVHAVPY